MLNVANARWNDACPALVIVMRLETVRIGIARLCVVEQSGLQGAHASTAARLDLRGRVPGIRYTYRTSPTHSSEDNAQGVGIAVIHQHHQVRRCQ